MSPNRKNNLKNRENADRKKHSTDTTELKTILYIPTHSHLNASKLTLSDRVIKCKDFTLKVPLSVRLKHPPFSMIYKQG